MKVRATKDINNWAVHHAAGPIVNIPKDTIIGDEYPDYFKIRLLDAGYAKQVTDAVTEPPKAPEAPKDEPKEDSGDNEGAFEALYTEMLEVVRLSKNDKAAKNKLCDLAKDRYGVEVDRRMTVENIMDAIMEAAKEAGV